MHPGNNIAKGDADILSTSSQGVPDAQGDVGHRQAQVDKELDDHIDATGNDAKATVGYAGKLGDGGTGGVDRRHKSDDQHHNPGDRTRQQGCIEAILCRSSSKGGSGAHHQSSGFHALSQSHNTVDAVGNERHGVICDKGCHKAVHYGTYPGPVFNHKGGPIDEEVQDAGGHRGQHGQPVDCSIDDRVKLGAVGHLVEPGEHRVKSGQGRVFHLCCNLGPGHGHTLKLGVDFIRRGKHGVFYHLSGDKALLCILLDGALCNAHVALNGPGNTGGVLQDGVKLLASEGSGGHGLGELEHCGRLSLCRCTADDKALVDKFHETDELIIVTKSPPSVRAHAGDSRGRVQVIRPGPLGGGHDFLLQSIHRAAVIHHETEAGRGAGQLIGQPREGL